ncbi:hypothetical protein [Burkholderia sp. 22313]|uniref:hypothetical protein n=1 Tax=Burkholderia sp. 22313 TaxID=3453908 RepID=UPI002D1689DD|nr:hypothetical protein [Burkholderia sp.]
MTNLLEAMRIFVAVVERGGLSGATGAGARATASDAPVAAFPPPDAIRRVDAASIAPSTSLHRSAP